VVVLTFDFVRQPFFYKQSRFFLHFGSVPQDGVLTQGGFDAVRAVSRNGLTRKIKLKIWRANFCLLGVAFLFLEKLVGEIFFSSEKVKLLKESLLLIV
jgi:hypothetical protein